MRCPLARARRGGRPAVEPLHVGDPIDHVALRGVGAVRRLPLETHLPRGVGVG